MSLVCAVSDVVVREVLKCIVVLLEFFWNEGDLRRWMGKESGDDEVVG